MRWRSRLRSGSFSLLATPDDDDARHFGVYQNQEHDQVFGGHLGPPRVSMLHTLGKPPLAGERPATDCGLRGTDCGLAGWTGSRRAALGPDSRQLVADQRQKDDRAPGERRIGGDLTRAEPGPERAEHDLEESEQRD